MDDQDKISLINLIMGQMSDADKSILERRLKNEPDLKEVYLKYKETIQKIDLYYASKSIVQKTDSKDFNETVKRFKLNSNMENNTTIMGSTGKIVLWIFLMLFIAIIVSWGFNYYKDFQHKKANLVLLEKQEKKFIAEKDSLINALETEDEEIRIKGVDFTGIALTRSGLYLVPYEWAHEGTILASTENSINKVPATVLWDDETLGLAILKFAVEEQAMLKKIPYGFSNKNYFLGVEVAIIAKNNNKIIYNYGRVISDNESVDTMLVKIQLKNEIIGAPVLDNYGRVIGLIKNYNSNGIAVVQKSISIYTMISEINLDKGITRISIPSYNSISKMSTPDKIRAFSPFLVQFNVRKNQ
jgi:hypothetical protein